MPLMCLQHYGADQRTASIAAPLALSSNALSNTITLLRPLHRSSIDPRVQPVHQITLMRIRRRSWFAPRRAGWIHSCIFKSQNISISVRRGCCALSTFTKDMWRATFNENMRQPAESELTASAARYAMKFVVRVWRVPSRLC